MKTHALVILMFICCSYTLTAQNDTAGRKLPDFYNYHSIDTTMYSGRNISVMHTLTRTYNLKEKFFRTGDSVFDTSENKTSLVYIKDKSGVVQVTLATIPVDNIIIDDTRQLILCLSRATISPYHIVLYNFNGELLFTKQITQFELIMDTLGYQKFRKDFPAFFEFVNHHQLVEYRADTIFVDTGRYWHNLSEDEKDRIFGSGWFGPSHYFPYLLGRGVCFPVLINLNKYENFYSPTDPFYDFEFEGDQLVGIILNNEYGGKVKIPITSK